jgi:hypothetical protein
MKSGFSIDNYRLAFVKNQGLRKGRNSFASVNKLW